MEVVTAINASVIVANVVSVNNLAACIYALCTQDYPSDLYEVIFPDDCSCSPEENALLCEFQKDFSHLRILRLSGKNRAHLLNVAARNAKSDLLLFLESHCLPTKNWVGQYVELFKSGKVDVARGELYRLPSASWASRIEDEAYAFAMKEYSKKGNISWFLHFHNAALRKKFFFAYGGLSEDLRLLCEYELGAFLHRDGTRISYVPEIRVYHFNPALIDMSREISSQGADRARILLKHGTEFMNTFFPNPKLVRFLPLLKAFRLPLYCLTQILRMIGTIGFYASEWLGSLSLARFFFGILAKNSVRSGVLKAFGDRKL